MLSMPYHAGLIVADIHEGIRDFEERLGYTFNDPVQARAEDMEDRISGTRGPIDLWISYTRESPFRLEVIQSSGDGVYGPKYLGSITSASGSPTRKRVFTRWSRRGIRWMRSSVRRMEPCRSSMHARRRSRGVASSTSAMRRARH